MLPNSAPIPSEDRRFRMIALGIALLALGARCWMAYTSHSTAEDFLISLRYAENIARGHGFAYNPGEHVLGTTTPLYTLILALAVWCRLDAILVGKALNILADSLTCYLLARLLARPEIRRPRAGLFVAALYAFSSTPLTISIAGMEAGIVTCISLAAILAYVAAWELPLYLLGAVLFLLRIDGLTLFGILAVALALRQRRIPWRSLAIAFCVTLPWLIFAYAYFGSPIPTSLIAKVIVYKRGMVPQYLKWNIFATQFITGAFQKFVTLLFVVGAIGCLLDLARMFRDSRNGATSVAPLAEPTGNRDTVGLSTAAGSDRTQWGLLCAPLLWLLAYYGAMLFSKVPAFAWYFLPPWPLFLALVALGGSLVVTFAGKRLPAPVTEATDHAWPIALAVLLLFGMAHAPAVRTSVVEAQRIEDLLRHPTGLWFHTHAGQKERILLEPIGYVGYYSQRRILDMIGLVSPEVIPSYYQPYYLTDIVRRLRPEWLCVRPQEALLIDRGDPQLIQSQYRFVRDFRIEGGPVQFLVYHRRQDSASSIVR